MLSIPELIQDVVGAIFAARGVPDYIWQSIAAMETGGTFKTDLVNKSDIEESYGLFQLNIKGGQGTPWAHAIDTLLDPATNATIAAGPIASAYYAGRNQGIPEGPELAAYVAANSGHPGYQMDASDYRIRAVAGYAKSILGLSTPSAGGAIGDGSGTGGTGTTVTPPAWDPGGFFTGIGSWLAGLGQGTYDLARGVKTSAPTWGVKALLVVIGVGAVLIALWGMVNKTTVVVKEEPEGEA